MSATVAHGNGFRVDPLHGDDRNPHGRNLLPASSGRQVVSVEVGGLLSELFGIVRGDFDPVPVLEAKLCGRCRVQPGGV